MQDTKNNCIPKKDAGSSEGVGKSSAVEYQITTVFHRTEEYLKNHIKLRFNTISLDIESCEVDANEWTSLNDNSLWVNIQKSGIKIGQNAFRAILKSDFVPKYNPLKEYFEGLPKWDGQRDFISQYANYVELVATESKEQFQYQFKKWCVRAVKCALIEGYFNKQAFVITDDGIGQNMGKSTWCRSLCPPKLSKYIAEDLSNNDKDTRVLICKNFLINMDELAALSKKEINQLKSLFSKDQINDRLPYEAKNSIIPRIASFIGSTNKSTFLHDETGSVRWLCFVAKNIDWNYKKDFDVNLLWAQAYSLSKDEAFIAELTKEDIAENELRNHKFQYLTPEMELLGQYFEPSNEVQGKHLRATEITTYLKAHTTLNINPIQVGKALKASNFERVKIKDSYGYYVKLKPVNY